jgi:ParB-like chromosome segregation protein Spo0J
MQKLNIVYRQIKDLKPYKKNAKKHSKEQVEQIANSIKEFGFTQPVIVDKHNSVVAGHGRILGAKKAGLKNVPTVCLEELTEEQIKAYRLVDNKLNESEWDFSLLDEELGILSEDIDMQLFGFCESEIEQEEVETKKKVEFEIKEKYEVHIICKDEKQMEQVFNKVKGYGQECKLVSTL